MAGIFALFTLALASTMLRHRGAALASIVAGLFLTLLVFWHHVTDVLKINW